MVKTILVTGAYGQVGSEVTALAPVYPQYKFLFTDKDSLDITDYNAVQSFFETHSPNVVFNCAAYTAVDKAETDAYMAQLINVTAVENLAKLCAQSGALLMHISTDFVYDGTKSSPYLETDSPNPLGVYAKTKLEGDIIAMALNPATLILRTSWVYSTYGNNFLKTMLRLGAEKLQLNVVFDQCGTPTYAADIAHTMITILPLINKEHYGLYHFSNEGVCSWYDFATEIIKAKGLSTNVHPIESKDFPTPVKRPHFSVLNKGKIKRAFDITIPHWRDAMLRCISNLE